MTAVQVSSSLAGKLAGNIVMQFVQTAEGSIYSMKVHSTQHTISLYLGIAQLFCFQGLSPLLCCLFLNLRSSALFLGGNVSRARGGKKTETGGKNIVFSANRRRPCNSSVVSLF